MIKMNEIFKVGGQTLIVLPVTKLGMQLFAIVSLSDYTSSHLILSTHLSQAMALTKATEMFMGK
jgi:hypothetical protein